MAAEGKAKVPGQRTLEAKLLGALEESLRLAAARVAERSLEILRSERPLRVGVAFSGGRDSTALLEAADRLWHTRRGRGLFETLVALHVNHGISRHADEWQESCRAFCADRAIPFTALRVRVDRRGQGIEAAARDARYRAIAERASLDRLDVVLAAHHQDDRLETFLLQWMRGAGVDGLSGMPPLREVGGGVLLARPWLDIPRDWIEAWARGRKLAWVEDESNGDTAILRNLIRHEVLPVLDRARPGFRGAASRSVELVGEAAQVLHSVAGDDMRNCRDPQRPGAIRIDRLLALPLPRQALCLREWIASEGIEPPPRSTLAEALRQARVTHSDTALSIRMGSWEIRRWGADLVLHAFAKPVRDTSRTVAFSWNGEAEVPLPPWGGVLEVRRAGEDEDGIPGEVLRRGPLEARARQGGEKIKLHRLRPSRTLKQFYQAKKVPAFERGDLPLVWCGQQLLFAAGLGTEVRLVARPKECAERWVLAWRPDRALLAG